MREMTSRTVTLFANCANFFVLEGKVKDSSLRRGVSCYIFHLFSGEKVNDE